MCFTVDQIERACGLLLLNEFNAFVYCCKQCQCEYDSGPNLEVHILSHQDDKTAVFANEGIFVENLEPAPMEYESTNVKIEQHSVNTAELVEPIFEEPTIDEVKPMTALFVNANFDDGNNIETDKAIGMQSLEQEPEQSEEINDSSENVAHSSLVISHEKLNPRPRKAYSDGMKDSDRKKCEICNIIPRSSYEYHMKIKHSDNPYVYKCDFCDATFKHNASRVIHMRTHTGEKPFACSICGKAFDTKPKRYRHVVAEHNKSTLKKHECPHCDKIFHQSRGLKTHIDSIHSGDRSYKCATCDKSFGSKRSLQDHEANHGEAKHKCRYCDRMFKTKGYRWHHEDLVHYKLKRTGTGEESGTDKVIEQSGMEQAIQQSDTEHAAKSAIIQPVESKPSDQDSTDGKSFPCGMCSKVFKQKQYMMRHRVRSHNVAEIENKICEICNRRTRGGFEWHMQVYHSDERYKCDLCDRTFKYKQALTIHMRRHTGEKPYLCSTCGKSFGSQSRCSAHERSVHGMMRNHQCQQCDKSFSDRAILQNHVNAVHTKERPWVCDICGKDFTSKMNLRSHKDSHDGPKYKCRYCDNKFKNRSSRWQHEMVYHRKVVMVGDKIINMYKKSTRMKMQMLKGEAEQKSNN